MVVTITLFEVVTLLNLNLKLGAHLKMVDFDS